jgi:hypothetical protein
MKIDVSLEYWYWCTWLQNITSQDIINIFWCQNVKYHIMYDLFKYIALCYYKRQINEAITYEHKHKQHYVQNIPNYIIFLNSLVAGFQLSVPIAARQKDMTNRGRTFCCCSHSQHVAVTVSMLQSQSAHCSHGQHAAVTVSTHQTMLTMHPARH